MATKGCVTVCTLLPCICKAFAELFNSITPLSISGAQLLVNDACAGNIKLSARPLLSAHSAQYIKVPRCKATFPAFSVSLLLAATRCTSMGNFKVTTSPFFQLRCNTAYPFSMLSGTAVPFTKICTVAVLAGTKRYKSDGMATCCAQPGMRIFNAKLSSPLAGVITNCKSPSQG